MTTSVTFNGTVYDLPVTGDSNSWGDSTTNFFIDLAANTLTIGSSKLKVRIATTTPVTILSTDAAVLTNLSSPSAIAVSLPVGVTNQYYVIGDGAGNAATYPLTITGSSGQQIDGSSTFTINWNYGCVGLLYTGSSWKVVNIYRPQTLATFPSRVSSTTSTTVTSNDSVVILNFNGNRTVSLPASPTNGTQISLVDGTDAYTYPIVITPLSGTIAGSSSFTFKELSATCIVEYDSSTTNWSVLSISKTPVVRRIQNDGANPIIIETAAASNQSVQIAPNQSTQLTINPPTAANADVILNGTAAMIGPSGTTAQRPSSPVVGMRRYNTDINHYEHYIAGAWRSVVDETRAQTLTNKALSDTTTTIINAADTTKKIILDVSTVTTGTTRTLTVPNENTTIVGTGATQVLTNKDIDGATASNSSRITLPKATKSTLDGLSRKQGTVVFASDQNKAYVDNGTSLVAIGSGSSGLYSTVDFEDNSTGGISTYADAAGSTPVDGTGGAPSSTFTVNASSPLRGTYDGLFTKSAANRQGEGFSLPITLSNADLGKTIQVIFDIKTSANFVSGDMVFYVYDVTNSVLITPSQTILPTGTSSQYSVAFQATTGTSYRLIWHVATTSALAYTVEVDQISYTSVVRPVVAGVSDWKVSSVTYSAGFGTVTNNVCEERREGDSIVFRGSLTSTSPTTTIASVTIPYTIDTTKLSIPANTSAQDGNVIGFWSGNLAAVGQIGNIVLAPATSTTTLYFATQSAAAVSHLTPASSTSTQVTTGGIIAWEARIPVANLSSNITLASSTGALQFVSNSTITDANDTTSFTYGALGSPLPGTLTALRTKRVQLSSPYTSIDDLDLFILPSTDSTPIKVGNGLIRNNAGTIIASPLTIQNTTTYGVGIQPVSGSKTQIDVVFGQYSYPSGATFASAGANWVTGNGNWFVKDRSSIGGAELAPATVTSQGTVAYSQWTASGIVAGNFSAGFGVCSAINILMRREGDSLHLRGTFQSGILAASLATLTLPSVNGTALTIDLTKVGLNNTSVQVGVPVGEAMDNGAAFAPYAILTATATSTTLLYFGVKKNNGVNTLIPANGSGIATSNAVQVIDCLVPILGWN